MDFIEIQIQSKVEFREILIAEISNLDYDGMIETKKGFNACIVENAFDEIKLKELQKKYSDTIPFEYKIEKVKKVNWNQEWESNFPAVEVAGKCLVRASFHLPDDSFPFEIIINPKMSFGTGHHETTALMITYQMELEHESKKVLDCGCGTGILSIFAEILGASRVIAIDIDEWAMKNAQENAILNSCSKIDFFRSKVSLLPDTGFDILLANINKNTLLSELADYSQKVVKNGNLLMSGFYLTELGDIAKKAYQFGFQQISKKADNEWVAALFKKI